jgi:hypothetical protein
MAIYIRKESLTFIDALILMPSYFSFARFALFEETHFSGFTKTKYLFMQAIILLVGNIVKCTTFTYAMKVYFVHAAANAHKVTSSNIEGM